jgi:hypothetical protein
MFMDPTLAEIYGTNQTDEADVEKLAAAELAAELTDDGDADIEGLTEEQLEEVAAEVMASGDENEEEAAVEEPAEEMQEKVAEADHLGRVMAHAFVQESREIEKEAGIKDLAKKGLDAAKTHGGKVLAKVKEIGGKAKGHAKRYGELMAGGEKPLAGGKRPGNALKLHAKGSHYRSEQLKSLGARAGTAAAVGAAGGAAAYKRKHSSALDTLVQQRALEILAANGVEIEPEETEKTSAADKYDVLADVVEQRAQELLVANGYEFQE